MFEITFGDLRNRNLHLALNYMLASKDYPNAKAAYRVAKLGRLFSQEAKTCDQVFVGLLEKEGIEVKPDGRYEVPDEKIDEWTAVYDDFCKTTAKINEDKLSPDILPDGLAPSQILALEALIEE